MGVGEDQGRRIKESREVAPLEKKRGLEIYESWRREIK